MCRVEIYNLVFPNGHIEQRQRVVNTCPRGTPSRPCHRLEYVHLHRDHLATPADIDEYTRRHVPIVEPRRSIEARPRVRDKPNSILEGFSIKFKMWKPFSSKEKKKHKKSSKRTLTVERRRRPDDQIGIVEHLPPAPTPPPAWVPQEREPIIIPSSPHRVRDRPQEAERTTRPPRRRTRQVVIHQTRESSESSNSIESNGLGESLPSEPIRRHERPHRNRPLTPVSHLGVREQTTQHERERRRHAERVAQAEHEARMRAERACDEELRQQHRIEVERQLQLESAERARRRQEQEDHERRERARRLQEQEDINAIRRMGASRPEQERLARRQTVRHPTTVHNPDDFEERGAAFLNSAMRGANRARFERNASDIRPLQAEGLWRRNTVDGSHSRPYGGSERRHQRRQGGSG